MNTMKKEWIEFFKKLTRMIDSGIPLLVSLSTILKESNQQAIAETCRVFIKELEKGKTLHEAMECPPSYFSPSMVMVVKTGELNGRLDKALLSVAAGIEEGSFLLPEVPETVVVKDGKTETCDKADVGDIVPVIRFVNIVLFEAVRDKASDIHIESFPEGVKLRYRVDGVMRELAPPPKALGYQIINRIKIMANMNIAEMRLPQDGRILMNIANQPIDMRVSYLPIVEGESVVIRILSGKSTVPTLDQIFKADHLATVRRWLKRPNGLVIVSGLTGSGKTTTLYSLIKSFDATRYKIMTVEDPVECRLEGTCQQRIRQDIGLTFPAALRATLRQDPDIIMAGELRDYETAAMLFHAALTGHLVMTTLHADGGVQTAQRLVDLGLEPFQVSNVLIGVISQRLFRMICQNCKDEIKPEPWMRELFSKGEMPKLFKGKGCEKCYGSGYRGRGAIHELFEPSDEIIRKLTRDASGAELHAEAVRVGLVTLRAESLAKVAEGVTTLDEIMPIIADLK